MVSTPTGKVNYANFLEAARINDPKAGRRIFTLGPYGNRISFAYQQSRAFALAAGFRGWFDEHHSGKDRGEVKIAVLGGGVGGVTLTSALFALGYTGLKLFERKADVLMDQAFASHRLIHPGYNTWPLWDEFNSTTRFPFLNWFAGPCNQVVAALKDEWDRDWRRRLDGSVRTGCSVTDAVFESEQMGVQLRFNEYGHADPTVEHFDYVFIALGFGEEKLTSLSSKSAGRYWNIDTIPQVAIDHLYEKLLCVGDSDGALIDCARLAFRGDIFRIATELMGAMSSDLGRSNDTRYWSRRRTDLEQKIFQAEKDAAEKSQENGVLFLMKFYTDLVKNRGIDINNILKKAVIQRSGLYKNRQVHLVGQSAAPFKPSSAPINKLIMAFLLNNNSVTYHQGRLSGDGDKKPFQLDAGHACPKFSEFDYRVIRIGATPPIEALFGSARDEMNQPLFKKVSEFPPEAIDTQIFLENYDLLMQLTHTPGTTENIRLRERQIKQFVLTYCRDAEKSPVPEPEFAACSSGEPGRKEIVVAEQGMLANAAARLGGFDFHLFGIPIVASNDSRRRERDSVRIDQAFQGRGR